MRGECVMVNKYGRRKRMMREAKGSGYDMLAAFEDKLEDLEDSFYDESLRMDESDDKKWLNTEVTKDEYKKLKKFLVDNGIKHEASGAYNLIHVEVYVDEYEKKKINDFIDTLDEGCYGKGKRKNTRR